MSTIDVVMTGDEAKLWRSFQKIVAGQKQVEDGFAKIGKKADETGKRVDNSQQITQKTFGGNALSMLTNYAAGLGTVGTAVGFVTAAFQKLNQEQQKSIQLGEQKTDSNIRLNQIANSPAQLKALQGQRDELAQKYGVDPRKVAGVQFDAYSNGFQDDIGNIIAANQAYDVAAMSDIAGRQFFKEHKLSPMQAINLVGMASKQSRLSFEQMTPAMIGAAEGAKQTTTTPTQLAAIVSALATEYKSGETAGDRVKAFGSHVGLAAKMGDARFAQKSMLESVDILRAMDDKERAKVLGSSQEVNAVYSDLVKNQAEIQRREALFANNNPMDRNSEVRQAMTRAALNPELQRSLALSRETIRNEISMEGMLGEGAYASATAIQRGERLDRADGHGPMMRYYRGTVRGKVDAVSDSPSLMEAATNAVTSDYQPAGPAALLPQTLKAIDSVFRRLDASAEKLDKASNNLEIRSHSRADAQRAEAQGGRE